MLKPIRDARSSELSSKYRPCPARCFAICQFCDLSVLLSAPSSVKKCPDNHSPSSPSPKVLCWQCGENSLGQLFDTIRCTKQLILRVTLLDLQVAGLQGCASTLGPKSFWRGRDSNPGLLLSWRSR